MAPPEIISGISDNCSKMSFLATFALQALSLSSADVIAYPVLVMGMSGPSPPPQSTPRQVDDDRRRVTIKLGLSDCVYHRHSQSAARESHNTDKLINRQQTALHCRRSTAHTPAVERLKQGNVHM